MALENRPLLAYPDVSETEVSSLTHNIKGKKEINKHVPKLGNQLNLQPNSVVGNWS